MIDREKKSQAPAQTDINDRIGDPVESTGCSAENEAVLLCFDRTKDWRMCKPELEAFRKCYEEYVEERQEAFVRFVKKTISEVTEEAIGNLKKDEEKPDPDSIAPIPFSTEQ